MAAKCAYVEKVGAVYYVRKRIPRAWKGRVEGDVVRFSLRTKDRALALKWGLEALAVFEELLRMAPEDALKHLTRRLVDEQLLLPDAMTGADLARRRALGNVGAKIIREARKNLGLGEHLDALYRELVFFNHATVQGEADYERRPIEEKMPPNRSRGSSTFRGLTRFWRLLAFLRGICRTNRPLPRRWLNRSGWSQLRARHRRSTPCAI